MSSPGLEYKDYCSQLLKAIGLGGAAMSPEHGRGSSSQWQALGPGIQNSAAGPDDSSSSGGGQQQCSSRADKIIRSVLGHAGLSGKAHAVLTARLQGGMQVCSQACSRS